jgi:hypothetical protein
MRTKYSPLRGRVLAQLKRIVDDAPNSTVAELRA